MVFVEENDGCGLLEDLGGTFALKENGSSKSSLKQPTLTSSKLLCLYTSLKAFFIGEKVNSLARENLRNKLRLKLNFLIQHFV